MWMIFVRAPLPDMPVWPGRRALALVDALTWPAAWVALAMQMPAGGGAVGQFVVAACMVTAVTRSCRALLHNHRYHFTTWRWGLRLLALLAFGWALRFAALLLAL